ncbi:MAG: U32 family peptidase [Ruminococcaceae bacterium]|nr:U32 family peptidase [Oscillospiraceae bacterium]
MLELLSPAGSFDALRAAVCNGADAVYLGVNSFNARRGARNFAPQELREAVRYCHVRGVKVHLTLNTLVSDREMRTLSETISLAAEAGVDAFIVQDLGVVSLCKQIAPQIELHASTQMSIHCLEGVREAAAMGITRAVLARELPREDIAFICRNSPIEIEVFAHGALCMCYSGQCYMSAIIGRRSGNRGQCAQPCRLPYGYGRFEDKYPLSLKDNCLVEYMQELKQLGVASVKIEGRMKRPEYVAIATGIYRKAIDKGDVSAQEMRQLRSAFSRQGFTQGYYLDKVGPDMFGTRVAEKEDKELLQNARMSYEAVEPQRIGVRFYIIVKRMQPIMLAVEDEQGNICKTQGHPPEPALHREITVEEIETRLAKTGGTPFYCQSVRSVVDNGLSVSAAELNRLRREVLTQLTALRGRLSPTEIGIYSEPQKLLGQKKAPKFTISVLHSEQITQKLLSTKPEMLYVPLNEIIAKPEFFSTLVAKQPMAAILPRVVHDDEMRSLLSDLDHLSALGVKRVLLGNLGQISAARSRGFEIAGDFGLNLYNSRAMLMAQRLGFTSLTASFEMTLAQLRDLSKPLPTEILIYGRLPLMLTENCLMKNRSGICSCASSSTKLVDRMSEEFRIIKDGGTCRSVVLNGKKLFLLDKTDQLRELGLWALRLSFTTENPSEIDRILSSLHGNADFDPGSCTRGLYLRGVE